MSNQKELMQQRKDKARESRQNGAKRRVERRTVESLCDWGSVDAALLVEVLDAVTADGGALRLGYTRDRGAFAIGIYGDGEPYTDYVSASDGIDEYLRDLRDVWAK